MFAFDAASAQGDHALALGFVETALTRDPKNTTLRAARTRALLRYGSLSRAEQGARDLLTGASEANDVRAAIDLLDLVLSVRASPDTAGVALGQFILRERAKRYGPDDPDAGTTHYYLARTHLQNGDRDAAVPHFTAFLASERKRAAGKPDEFAWMLRGIGTTLANAGRPTDAIPVLREYVAVAEADAKAARKLPAEMPADARRLLGLALWQTGARDEAAQLLTAAHPDLAATFARIEAGGAFRIHVSREDLRKLVQLLIDHHTDAGREDEAAAWRNKLPPPAPAPPKK
jgi:tetratricopeptide (TPR) repeat protein